MNRAQTELQYFEYFKMFQDLKKNFQVKYGPVLFLNELENRFQFVANVYRQIPISLLNAGNSFIDATNNLLNDGMSNWPIREFKSIKANLASIVDESGTWWLQLRATLPFEKKQKKPRESANPIPEIEQLHEGIFQMLSEWSAQTRQRNSELNKYFYMRNTRDERFKKGYWFPGNDNYICISFWAGGDSINKTPNIYFEIHKRYGCRIVITARDSELKKAYFKTLVEFLEKNDHKFTYYNNRGIWIKELSKDYKTYLAELNSFMVHEKRIIDEFLDAHEDHDTEDFISRFSFISPRDFDRMCSKVLTQREEIKNSIEITESVSEPNRLPFCLSAVTIENFQGVLRTEITNLDLTSNWIFITGENGYGKTTILQAIALGLNADTGLDNYYESNTRIGVEFNFFGKKTTIFRGKTSDFNAEVFLDLKDCVLGYGPARLNVQLKDTENISRTNENPLSGLFDSTHVLKNINYELFASAKTDMELFHALREIILYVTNGRIADINISERQALFVEKLSNGDSLPPMPIHKLAAGFRAIINMAFDIYLRLKNLFHVYNPSEFYGIVIIDELENHLHPILQCQMPALLSKVFPNVQFIASTHSPIPLLGAPKNSIILTAHRNNKDGVTIERLDEIIEFKNLLPNAILTSPIFGFWDIIPKNRDENTFVKMESIYSEIEKNVETEERIKQYFSDKNASDLLKLLKK